jgi:Mg-chelatase subunit ChlD
MTARASIGGGLDSRAAAPLVGIVLLFGIVAAGAGIIFWTGMDAKESVQATAEVDAASTSIEALSAAASSVAHRGGSATADVDFGRERAEDVSVVTDGVIRFRLNGKAACTAERPLGTVVYEQDSDAAVAYQAGGVFERTPAGATVVQTPDLEYRTETMDGRAVRTVTFPVTNLSGSVDGSGEIVASAADESSDGIQSDLCLAGGDDSTVEYVREVTIAVEGSDYYRAWREYFEQEFGAAGEYDVDHDAQSTSVTAPLDAGVRPSQFGFADVRIYGGVFSTSSAGELRVQTKHATVDSYDADDAPWGGAGPTYGNDGDVLTRGDVSVQANGAEVAGTVYAEGVVSLSTACGAGGAYCVDGSAYVNNSTVGSGGPTTALFPAGSTERAAVVSETWGNGTVIPALSPMDDEIDDTVSTVETYNDNDDVAAVSGGSVQYDAGSAALASGVYYLDDLTVPAGNTLTLDTSGGDVVLAVDGDVDVGDDAKIEVTGSGQVRAYVAEPTGSSDQLTVGRQAAVVVTDGGTRTYRSNALVVACKAGCSASFEKGTGSTPTQFTGVLYGPGDDADDGTVSLGKHVEVWGAIAAGTVTFEQQSSLHFDRTLRGDAGDADDDGVLDVADADSDFPDGDGDGFSESEDACPELYGTGESGCPGVGEDESANALVVNQTSATVTVLGSQIAEERVYETTTETREPLNVELVIDDSGSMNLYENYGFEDPYGSPTYDYVSGPQELSAGSNVTVPDGVAYVADDDGDGDVESDGDVFYPGETVDGGEYSHYHVVEVEGSDVAWERVPAARTFVGALDPAVDQVGVVRFDLDVYEERTLTSDFDSVNDTLVRSTFSSDGGTNIYESLDEAIQNLEDADDADDVDAQETIVLLTDGKHSDVAPGDETDIRALAEEAHEKGIRIYVVALGDESDYDEALLDYIANEDGGLDADVDGRLYEVQNAANLSEKFEEIAVDSTDRQARVVQHANTSTTIHVGASAVSLDGNTNPVDGSPPSKTITGALDPGDLVHVSSTTYECDGNATVDTTTNPSTGEIYDVTRCDGTDGTDAVTTNADHQNHQVFTDGDAIPSVQTSAWYADGDRSSLRAVVEDYDTSLVDGDTFDLPENEAIVLVNLSDGGDVDFTVLYVAADDRDPPAPANQTVDVPSSDDRQFGANDGSSGTANDYVVDVTVDDVNVTGTDGRVVPARPRVATAVGGDATDDGVPPDADLRLAERVRESN